MMIMFMMLVWLCNYHNDKTSLWLLFYFVCQLECQRLNQVGAWFEKINETKA